MCIFQENAIFFMQADGTAYEREKKLMHMHVPVTASLIFKAIACF